MARLKSGLPRVGVERGELLRIGAADEDRGLVRRGRRHREDGAVARVERDDRASVGGPVVVLVREVDPVLERLLGGALELHVEREAQRVARRASCRGTYGLTGRPSESTRIWPSPGWPRRYES